MTTVGVIVIICVSLLISRPPSCGGGPSEIKNPDILVIACGFDIASLDPGYAYDGESAGRLQNIYETLIQFAGNSTSEFLPSLATEWTISEDGKTYRFKIREGVTFHNGNSLTSADVEYSFERGMVQDYALGPQWMFFEPLFGLGNYSSRNESGLIPLEEIKSKVEVDGQWLEATRAIKGRADAASPYIIGLTANAMQGDREACLEAGMQDYIAKPIRVDELVTALLNAKVSN